MIFLSTLKIKCYYHSHNHYYPFPSIERDGWSKSDDILEAIWDHLFLNIMSWTLVSHCLLKVDTKFDYVCVTRTAFHSSHISHVWIVLLSCFNTLFTRCLFVCFYCIYSCFILPTVFGLTLELSDIVYDSPGQTCSVYCLVCLRKCRTGLAP